MMEHRWHIRRRMAAKVVLNSPALGQVHAKIRDLGAGGVCVDTLEQALTPNLHVNLTFALESAGILRIYRVPALVVWASRDSAGLMFYEIFPETLRGALSKLRLEETARLVDNELVNGTGGGN